MMLQKDQDNNKEQKVPFNLQFIHVLQLHSNNYLSLGSLWSSLLFVEMFHVPRASGNLLPLMLKRGVENIQSTFNHPH